METEKYYFRVGIFFLLVITAFVYYTVAFGRGSDNGDLKRYAIYFDNSVTGLSRGAPVKLKGIEVGLVDDIRFMSRASDRILVTVDIDETAPIHKDTVASTAFQGITGTTYLSLENTRPNDSPEYLTKVKDEKYLVIPSKKSEFQAALADAPELMGGLAKTAAQAQKLLSDKNILALEALLSSSNDAMTEAKGALREIKMLARTIREDPSVIVRGSNYEGYKVENEK